MSPQTAWYGDYTVDASADGVTVEKGLDLDTLPLPAVKLRISADRDERLGVVVEERIPDSVPVENVGFHPGYGADDWTVHDDRLKWSGTLDHGATILTIYGVWLTETRQIYDFLRPPTVATVRSLGEDEHWMPVRRSEAPKHLIDDSLSANAPDWVNELKAEVEESLSGALQRRASEREAEDDDGPSTGRAVPGDAGGKQDGDAAEPGDDSIALGGDVHESPVASGADATSSDADGDGSDDEETPPDVRVERAGAASLETPSPRDIHELDDRDVPGDHVYVRAIVRDGHHGGGAPAVLQELANAMDVLGRRVEGETRDTERLDAIVVTDYDLSDLANALAERPQVTDVLVTPVGELTGDAPTVNLARRFESRRGGDGPVSPDDVVAELDALSQALADEGRGLAQLVERTREGRARSDGDLTIEAVYAELVALRGRIDRLEDRIDDRLGDDATHDPSTSERTRR